MTRAPDVAYNNVIHYYYIRYYMTEGEFLIKNQYLPIAILFTNIKER